MWGALGLLHYTARFRLYGAWKETLAGDAAPLLAAATKVTQLEVRKIMRRLSKENIKEFGRKLGKVTPLPL